MIIKHGNGQITGVIPSDSELLDEETQKKLEAAKAAKKVQIKNNNQDTEESAKK